MCDAYAQSTQHARAVAWLETGSDLVWQEQDVKARAHRHAGPKRQQRTGRLAQLQARLHSLRSQFDGLQAAAQAQGRSVQPSPARR